MSLLIRTLTLTPSLETSESSGTVKKEFPFLKMVKPVCALSTFLLTPVRTANYISADGILNGHLCISLIENRAGFLGIHFTEYA